MSAESGTDAAQAFLNAVFAGVESGGYISVVEVPGDEGVAQEDRWRAMKQTYLATRPNMIPQLADLRETSAWYFSPVIYSAQSRTKMHVLEGSVLWVDLDNEKVDPFAITPRPSIVVVSSKGHYHLYWLLANSMSAANLEHYNRRLAYAIGADRSGWDANQLLRLPAGLNIKHDPPDAVRLLQLDASLVYTIDMFAALPEAPKGREIVQEEALPTQDVSIEWLMEKWGDQMSARMVDLLKRRQADRSRALWLIANECARMQMPVEHCYFLVRGTPNDKFQHLRYLAAESLWRDILGAYQQTAAGQTDRGIVDKISSIRMDKIHYSIKLQRIGEALLGDMSRTGMFYQTAEGSSLYYLDLSKGVGCLIPVGLRSQGLRKLMIDRYAINPGTQEWMGLYELIAARCQDDEPVRVHRFSYYAAETGVLYINKYDNQIYRVTAAGYEIVPNGADGVLFLNPVGAEPFSAARTPHLNGHSPRESLWEQYVLRCANLPEDPQLDAREVRHIIHAWVLSFFFKDMFPVKPIILVHGETGSGKTMLFKAILRVLVGPNAMPDAPYGNEESFDNAATNSEFLFVDNVDDKVTWLANKLALVATGAGVKKRKLYTDNDAFTATASCFVGITSRSPRFLDGRDDVVERVVPVAVVPYAGRMVNEYTIVREIDRHRAFLWGELLDVLSRTVSRLGRGGLPTFQGDFRQADFGSFLGITAPMANIEPSRLYSHIKRMQGIEATEDNPLVLALRYWISNPKNIGREVTPASLHTELAITPGGTDFVRRIVSPRSLTTQLTRNARYMAQVGIYVTKHGSVAPMYSFRCKDDT